MKREKRLMDLESFQSYLDKILADTDQYTHMTFSGMGEPLLDLGLRLKVQRAHSEGLEITIITNGKLLSEDAYTQMCDDGVDTVRVSLLGTTGLEKAKEMAKWKGYTKLNINAVVTTEGQAKRIEDNLADKVNQLEIWSPHNWAKKFDYRPMTPVRLKNCGRIFSGPLQVLVDGRVAVCCFDYEGHTSIGSLEKSSLSEIWQSEAYIKQVTCSNTGKWQNTGYPCSGCDQRNDSKKGVLLFTTRKEEDRVERTSTSFQPIESTPNEKRKPCLKCGKPFKGESKFNRICSSCKTSNAGMGRFAGGLAAGREV